MLFLQSQMIANEHCAHTAELDTINWIPNAKYKHMLNNKKK